MGKDINFLCSIAETQSALKFGAKIGRVTFEIPESEIPKAVALIAMQGEPLELEVSLSDSKGQIKTGEESGSKGQRPWLQKRTNKTGRSATDE